MFAIIGILIVFGCVVAGYLMEHGNLRVLIQPAELIIIGGAAVGTVLIGNPLHIIKKIAAGIGGVFGSSKFGKETYVNALKMMYELLNKARKDGLMALEADVEEPEVPFFPRTQPFSRITTFVISYATRCGWRSLESTLLIWTRCLIWIWRCTTTIPRSRRLPSPLWRTLCPGLVSWRRCSAL